MSKNEELIKTPFTMEVTTGKYKGKMLTIAGSSQTSKMQNGMSIRIHEKGVNPNGYGWRDRVEHYILVGKSRNIGPKSKLSFWLDHIGVDSRMVRIMNKF